MAWKALARSATGTSHQTKQIPCQDYGHYRILDRNIIIGAVSDGMGSAKYSDIGSELTVETTLDFLEKLIKDDFKKNKQYLQKSITQKVANKIFRDTLDEVFAKLSEISRQDGYELNDLACTLITFISTPNWQAAMQVGDGFLVVRQNNEEYHLLLSGEKGEYANVTTPVTSKKAQEKMQVKLLTGESKFICASTDGLEMVAIDRRNWLPADIFFEPLEEYMNVTNNPEEDDEYIRNFLDSDQLNNHTNDDKTLLTCFYEVEKIQQKPKQLTLFKSDFFALIQFFIFNILFGCSTYLASNLKDSRYNTSFVLFIIMLLLISFIVVSEQLQSSFSRKNRLVICALTSIVGLIFSILAIYIFKIFNNF